MIVFEDGHYRSVRSVTEDSHALTKELSTFSPEEKAAVQEIIKQYSLAGKSSVADMAEKYEWDPDTGPPVPIREWVNSTYYLGETAETLFPKLKEDMIELFEGNYYECILTGCIDQEAIVQCSDGSMPLLGELIGRSASVVTVDEDEGVGHHQSDAGVDSGVRRVLDLTLTNGMSVKLTPDHKVLTQRGWVRAQELDVEKDRVLRPRKIDYDPSCDSLKDEEVKLLAYWAADGSSSTSRARYCDGRVETGSEVIDSLKRLGYSSTTDEPYEKNGAWEVHVAKFATSGFRDFLRRHGLLGVGSGSRVVPEAVCRSPLDQVALFLNRVWAAEGTVAYKSGSPGRFQLAMKSRRFIQQVQLLLLRWGIQSRIYKTKSQRHGKPWTCWTLAVSGKADVEKFYDAIGSIYSKEWETFELLERFDGKKANTNVDVVPLTWGEANDYLIEHGIKRSAGDEWWKLGTARSRHLSRQMFGRFCEAFESHPAVAQLAQRFPESVAYEKIESVIAIDVPIPVADIGVPGPMRFTANGVCVHNSIGWGKDYFATTAMLRVVYELICLKNPQDTLGLGKGEVIHIVPVSHTKEAARRVVFQGISRKLHLSPFFKDRFKETNEEIKFKGKGVVIIGGGSNDNSALGLNVWSALTDECVSGETEILTPDGYIAAHSLADDGLISKPIIAYDTRTNTFKKSDGYVRPASFTDIYEVELDDGRVVRATEEHPFLVDVDGDQRFVYLRNLSIGDRVVVRRSDDLRPEWGEESVLWKDAHEGGPEKNVGGRQEENRATTLGGNEEEDKRVKQENKVEDEKASEEEEVQRRDLDSGEEGSRRRGDAQEVGRSALSRASDAKGERIQAHRGVEGENSRVEQEEEGKAQAFRGDKEKDKRVECLEGGQGELQVQGIREHDKGGSLRIPILVGEEGNANARQGQLRGEFLLRSVLGSLHLERKETIHHTGSTCNEDDGIEGSRGGEAEGLHIQRKGDSEGRGLPEVLQEEAVGVLCMGRESSLARIVAIRSKGRGQTFDVMSLPHGNFVANGVVVHNTNFMGKVKKSQVSAGGKASKKDKAQSVYDALQRRVKSRYAARGLKGLLFLVSSKLSTHDFTERRIAEVIRANDPGVFVRDYATWDVRPNAFIGQKWWRAAVSQREGRVRILGDAEATAVNEIEFKFPDEYYNEFQNDPEGAARDIAGIALESFNPFFTNRRAIDQMMNPRRAHPFHVFEWNTSRNLKILWDAIMMNNAAGDPVPRCCPGAWRHVHMDLSKNQDATGFCVGHLAGGVEVTRRDPETGEQRVEEAPVVHIDLALRIIPPYAGEIEHDLVRSLIYDLAKGGLPVRSVSADRWMGLPNLQMIRKQGFKVEEVSTQKTLEPYIATRSAVYEGRVECPDYPFLGKELRELELHEVGSTGKKFRVDHPKDGSKDVSDAFAGVVYYITKNARSSLVMNVSRGNSKSIPINASEPYPTRDGWKWPDEPEPDPPGEDSSTLPSWIIT